MKNWKEVPQEVIPHHKRSENEHDVTLWYLYDNGVFKFNHLEHGLSNELKPIPKSESQLSWANKRWLNEWAYLYDGKVIHQGEFDFGLKDLPNKEWYPLLDYEGYFINKKGDIKSTKSNKDKILKWHVASNGYLTTSISDNGNQIRLMKHRVLAETFINNPFGFKYVNHKDGDKLNSTITNVQWIPHKENIRHASRSNYEELA